MFRLILKFINVFLTYSKLKFLSHVLQKRKPNWKYSKYVNKIWIYAPSNFFIIAIQKKFALKRIQNLSTDFWKAYFLETRCVTFNGMPLGFSYCVTIYIKNICDFLLGSIGLPMKRLPWHPGNIGPDQGTLPVPAGLVIRKQTFLPCFFQSMF